MKVPRSVKIRRRSWLETTLRCTTLVPLTSPPPLEKRKSNSTQAEVEARPSTSLSEPVRSSKDGTRVSLVSAREPRLPSSSPLMKVTAQVVLVPIFPEALPSTSMLKSLTCPRMPPLLLPKRTFSRPSMRTRAEPSPKKRSKSGSRKSKDKTCPKSS